MLVAISLTSKPSCVDCNQHNGNLCMFIGTEVCQVGCPPGCACRIMISTSKLLCVGQHIRSDHTYRSCYHGNMTYTYDGTYAPNVISPMRHCISLISLNSALPLEYCLFIPLLICLQY